MLIIGSGTVAVLEWGPRFRDEEFTGREVGIAEIIFFGSGSPWNTDQTVTVRGCAHDLLTPGPPG